MKSWIKTLLVISLCIIKPVSAIEAGNYYRYKDSQGNTVMSNNLPPDAANQGYEVISPRGNVLEKIPPRKSEQELVKEIAEKEKREALDQKRETERQKALEQAQKDEILLKSFSSEADITRSRDDKIAAIEVLETITKDNIKRLEKQLSEANQMVTTLEQKKSVVPVGLKKTIADTQRQIRENQIFLENKAIEKENIHKSYQDLINRFQQLKR